MQFWCMDCDKCNIFCMLSDDNECSRRFSPKDFSIRLINFKSKAKKKQPRKEMKSRCPGKAM